MSVSAAARRHVCDDEDVAVLCRLAYYALSYGKAKRAADYLTAAALLSPEHPQVLRLQAVAYADAGAPAHALAVLRTLDACCGAQMSPADRATFLLLKSRALYATEAVDAARECFIDYLAARKNSLAAAELSSEQ